jgi:hypothetical protein
LWFLPLIKARQPAVDRVLGGRHLVYPQL